MSLLPARPPTGSGRRPPPASGRPIQGRDVALTVAVILAAMLGTTLVIALLFGVGPPASASEARVQLIVKVAANFLVLFGSVYAVMIRTKGYSWEDLGVRPIPVHWRRTSILLGLVLVPVIILLASTIQRQTGAESQSIMRAISSSGFSLLTAVTLFLYIALLQPIVEELLFRGILYGWLRRSQSFAVTNVLCAGAFGIVHFQLIAILIGFILGLVMGWLRERSNSVLAPILMHQVYNGATLTFAFMAAASVDQTV